MSLDTATTAEILQLHETTSILVNCSVSIVAVLLFEYFITLGGEVRLVWGLKFTGATLLFLLNRYLIFAVVITNLATAFPVGSEVCIGPGLERKRIASHTLSCTFLVRFGEVLEILQIIDLAVFTSLRAFALSDRNWRIALPVLISSLVPAGLDLYYYLNQTPIELFSPINCTTIDGVTEPIDNTFTIVSRVAFILANTIVIVVTWTRTYRTKQIAAEAGLKMSIGMVILRDGTIYFLVLLTLNILHLILAVTNQFRYLTVFMEPIKSILVSRFLLNLRGVDPARDLNSRLSHPGTSPDSHPGTLRFASSFVDPLGAPLEYGFSPASEPLDMDTYLSDHIADDDGGDNNNDCDNLPASSDCVQGPSHES